ncbi:M56 family metallopeptidase [Longimicrobium sp.]|uniref:M56 family metallopeptidase n=1 Tax=Longimicrobium sp. TaxID=2029185 RepID=UPI002E335C3E|nr:M56 family metallopeptidase [Longimicrobium sp.]HEX6038259.1 M56 family metallopeptidase [Longimicrobium sp.]
MIAHLARVSLEGALLAGGVWLACRALPRMSPRVRALLWWCVAAKFVVALLWLTPIRVPVLPRASADAPNPVAAAQAPSIATGPTNAEDGVAASRTVSPPTDSHRPEIPWTAVLAGAWALGLAVSLVRTLRDWRRTRAVVARSLPAGEALHTMVRELSGRMATRRTVDVRVSAEIESPLIVGVRRPVILVPAQGFALLSPDQQRMALCHELAHLSRGDLWLGCVPAAAERCFFFHPLARLAAREYAFWREAACDEAVLTTLHASPQSYGRMLLALGVSRRTPTFSAAGAAWSFQTLKRRITMLDHSSSRSFRGRALAAGAVAVAILAVAPIKAVARSAASRPQAAAPAQTPAASPSAADAPVSAASAVVHAAGHAVTAKTGQSQEEIPFVVLRGDDNVVMSGSSRDVERARRLRRGDEPLLWFRYGGQEYVVRDAAVLREVDELWGPVGRIGEEQGRIGEQQGAIGEAQGRIGEQLGRIGERQGTLGARQGELGARLGALAAREVGDLSDTERRAIEREHEQLETEMRRLDEQMEALDQEMRRVERPMDDRDGEMEALGEQMEALGDRMEAAVERAQTGMHALVRRAIESGAAEAVR